MTRKRRSLQRQLQRRLRRKGLSNRSSPRRRPRDVRNSQQVAVRQTTTRTRCSIRERRRGSRRSASSNPISAMLRSSSAPPPSRVRRCRHRVASFFSHPCALTGSADADLDKILKSSPQSKEDFVALSDAIIAHIVRRHQDKPLYATFVEHHARALAQPLRDVDVRKAASGLTTLANEKQREKTSGKKKPKSVGKPILGASKIGNKYSTLDVRSIRPALTDVSCRLDTTVYDEALDDFGSNADDFM